MDGAIRCANGHDNHPHAPHCETRGCRLPLQPSVPELTASHGDALAPILMASGEVREPTTEQDLAAPNMRVGAVAVDDSPPGGAAEAIDAGTDASAPRAQRASLEHIAALTLPSSQLAAADTLRATIAARDAGACHAAAIAYGGASHPRRSRTDKVPRQEWIRSALALDSHEAFEIDPPDLRRWILDTALWWILSMREARRPPHLHREPRTRRAQHVAAFRRTVS